MVSGLNYQKKDVAVVAKYLKKSEVYFDKKVTLIREYEDQIMIRDNERSGAYNEGQRWFNEQPNPPANYVYEETFNF